LEYVAQSSVRTALMSATATELCGS
jgi:hypothetical protein